MALAKYAGQMLPSSSWRGVCRGRGLRVPGQKLVHLGAAHRTDTLHGGTAILGSDGLRVLHCSLNLALHAISLDILHVFSSFLVLNALSALARDAKTIRASSGAG
jgi:hypothetical protein